MQTHSESEIGHCVEYTSKKVAEQSRAEQVFVRFIRRSISGQKGLNLGRVTTLLRYRLAEKGVLSEVVQTSRISNNAFVLNNRS
jgi:hypothetical protein